MNQIKNLFFNIKNIFIRIYSNCFRTNQELKEPRISNMLHKRLYYHILHDDIKMKIFISSFITKARQKKLCCNPSCNNMLICEYYLGYDGRYCSEECREVMINILDKYWQNMI